MQRSFLGAPQLGTLASGPLDAITDVAGVSLGHVALSEGAVQTGATVLLPATGDLFLHKLPAGLAVINGFGKSAGLMQVQELGQIESPIALVSTFAVGSASTALIRDAIAHQPELARSLPTLNPWSSRSMTAGSTTLSPRHCRSRMCCRRCRARARLAQAPALPRARSAPGGACTAMGSRAASARPRASSAGRAAATPWAPWCWPTRAGPRPCPRPA